MFKSKRSYVQIKEVTCSNQRGHMFKSKRRHMFKSKTSYGQIKEVICSNQRGHMFKSKRSYV